MIKFYSKKKNIELFRKRSHLQLQPGTARGVLQHPKHPHFRVPERELVKKMPNMVPNTLHEG